MNLRHTPWWLIIVGCTLPFAGTGCSSSGKASSSDAAISTDAPTSTGGSARGGAPGTGGGFAGSSGNGGGGTTPGGAGGRGGTTATGGTTGAGGVPSVGGTTGAGGVPSVGGTTGKGGTMGTGGTSSTGCTSSSDCPAGWTCAMQQCWAAVKGGAGGTTATGGVTGSGSQGTGGTTNSGGSGGTTSLDAGYTGDGRGLDTGSNDVALPGCSQVTTQSACDVRADCYSVFVVTGCELDAGHSCTQFGHCADGRKANCTGPALCKSLAPNCPAPYVVSYTDTCYEGCVSQSECPTPTCPQTAPSDGGSCGVVDYSCFYEDCTGAGRTQAKCTAGTWSVQTAACSTITCAGGGISTESLICAAGQVCMRTTGGGGAFVITPSCAANNCGTAPISTQCIQGASDCGLSSSLSGIIVNCNAPSSCGSGQGGCA